LDFIALINQIPPALYGIMLGSFLTILGVILTNISNTKRLKLQHEHERKLRNKERDLSMRREVYMDAMEAISAGITAISRFSDLHESPEALMQSYSSMSSKESRVMIVGTNDTVKALANFNVELNGAFLRLSAKRETFDAIHQKTQQTEREIEKISNQLEQIYRKQSDRETVVDVEKKDHPLTSEYANLEQQRLNLQKEFESLNNQLIPLIQNLVKDSIVEVGSLNQHLVPIVACMRAELELPFDEAFYTRVLGKGHEKLNEHLASFFEGYDTGAPDNP